MKIRSCRGSCQASAAFELIAVVGISGLISSSILPLFGSTIELERFRSVQLKEKQNTYLFSMEANGLGMAVPFTHDLEGLTTP